MQDATQLTLKNRTGMQISPIQGRELMESLDLEVPDAPPGDDATPGDGRPAVRDDVSMRREYILAAGPLGTIPPPLTVKGVAKSAVKMLTGNRPQVLLDKLAERAAYERGGTRLYDALLVKYVATHQATTGRPAGAAAPEASAVDAISEGALLEIRTQEAEHYQLLVECIAELGGDPTAETPSADLVGVQTLGLLQVVTDPRTTLMQSLHAALAAELVDVAGWELLMDLAEAMGQDAMLDRFRVALDEEEEHLRLTRAWYSALAMAESGNPVSYVER
jgi:ferritin-like protein